MSKVIYIIRRTDGKASFHEGQFVRETTDHELQRFVTTSTLISAKKFASDRLAMKFLSSTNPSNTWTKIKPDGGFSITCYEIIIVDSAAVAIALSQGRTPQALKEGPYAVRVFCSTLGAESPSSVLPGGV